MSDRPARAVQLRVIGADQARDLLAGGRRRDWHPDYPLAGSLAAAGMFLERAAVQDPGPWGIFWIVADGQVVGDVGFHGPPGPGPAPTVEIGYSVVPARRGQGLASAATRELLDRAARQGAVAVRAETSPDNLASQRVLVRCGFRPTAPTPTGDLTFTRVLSPGA